MGSDGGWFRRIVWCRSNARRRSSGSWAPEWDEDEAKPEALREAERALEASLETRRAFAE